MSGEVKFNSQAVITTGSSGRAFTEDPCYTGPNNQLVSNHGNTQPKHYVQSNAPLPQRTQAQLARLRAAQGKASVKAEVVAGKARLVPVKAAYGQLYEYHRHEVGNAMGPISAASWAVILCADPQAAFEVQLTTAQLVPGK